MHLTVDPLFILLALAALLPWAKISPALRALVFRGRLALLLARLQRKHRSTILVFTGPIERYLSFALVRDIRAAPIDRPLILAAHRGRVVVRVPDECWSSGTVAALGADEIVLAPDANLGFCDPIFKGDPSLIHTGPVMTAAVRGEAIDIVRSKHAHRDLVCSLTAARQARGETPGDARALAERLVMSDSDHWQPLFIEEASALGLPVRVDADPVWYQVLRFAGWSRWPG